MTFKRNAFMNFLFFTIAFTEVATWTIDLPEVRKYLFEKNEKHKLESKSEFEDYLSNDQTFYSNIEGNSKHNSKDYEHDPSDQDEARYADGYGYHSYMEKKVVNIVRDGSAYLEGLRRSLEDYSVFLESCSRQNSSSTQNTTAINSTTAWSPPYDFLSNSSSMSSFNSTGGTSNPPLLSFQNFDNSTVPNRPISNSSGTQTPSMRNRPGRRMSCAEAMEASEQVRRYADLSMWATKRLQDLAYAKKYQKTDEQEEDELILKLAWFLDRLAYLSGYEPEYKDYEPNGTKSSPTTAPTAPTLVPSSDELNREMMDCLRQNSTEPATVRCRYPMQIPDLMSRMFNSSGTISSSPTSEANSVIPMITPTDNIADQSLEILITADDSSPKNYQKSPIKKRSTDYTFYYPPKPHETQYPVPLIKLIRHRLSHIKAIVKALVEKRLAHIAEKQQENKHYENHFEKRSIDETNKQMSNFINPLSNSPTVTVKSVEKRPIDETGSPVGLIHYPVSDVSVINTKSFKKRSLDDRSVTIVNRLSNLKSTVKSVKKGPLFRKMFEGFHSSTKVKRLSKSHFPHVKSNKKRFTDDPLSKLANYYLKYKVWDNSNPKHNYNKKEGILEVKNHVNEPKIIKKRSLFNKKIINVHLPKPLEIVRTYVHGHRHHRPHTVHKTKLVSQLQKLHDFKHKKLVKVHKNIKKRSLRYGDMYLPRIPVNPHGDISYYIKNKQGTNYNPSLVQAGQVRLGLEQIFQTGNIEVVRRFGSNYNPLNPAPFYTGVLLGMADA